ncbi:hypothetical protein BH24ACI1_BH24ACI1_22650 [soil metagenome]|jgi:hypothetical protein
MNRKQKLLHAVAGFFVGNIILAALIFGFSSTKNYQSFDTSLERIRRSEVREINIRDKQADLLNVADSDLLVRLIQILIWLFLISPPIIVVLLLVIISKMNRKKSLE